jgi:hypothetical protein
MSRTIGKQLMRGLGFSAAAIILLAVTLIVMTVMRTPSRDEKLVSLLGPGRIIESDSGHYGFDGHYWARFECDPTAVREHIKTLRYPSQTSQEIGPRRLTDRFINPRFPWPSNIRLYTEDWIQFKTGTGCYMIVAFSDDETREVFFLQWDT